MAHFALCPRADPLIYTGMTPRQTEHPSPDRAFTWQQQEDIGTKDPRRRRKTRKGLKCVALDLEATTRIEAAATDHPLPVPRSNVKPPRIQSKARNKASARDSSGQPKPPDSTLPTHGLDTVEQKPQSKRKNRRTGKPRGKPQPANMTAQPAGVLVPPHLRKRAAASTAPAATVNTKADVRLGDLVDVIGVSDTSPTSVPSQPPKSAQIQFSPVDTIPRVYAPPSPPTTVEKSPKVLAWDDPKPPESLPQSKRNHNPRWPRPPKAPKERYVWPKARDIPRELSAGSQSDGGITFKSDSEGDPAYDVKKLLDWSGDWLPPPEDWAARKGFTSRHFSQVVEQWANEHSRDCTKLVDIDSPDFLGTKNEDDQWLNKDVVPRYWLHETIDNCPSRRFWEELPHRAPAALSDVDIMEHPPYWERWDDARPDGCFMKVLEVPDARIDSTDVENELDSTFAGLCVEERLARIKEIREKRLQRHKAKQNRPVPKSTHAGPSLLDRQLKPKANIYLRPVQPADIPGIVVIYNHYIKNTVHAAELEEQTEAQIRVWIDGIVQAGLPCLVAVSKRNQRKGPQGAVAGYVTEAIVGFACLTELADPSAMYRFTFDLEVYIHPGYIHQGVGKCLLDQMMHMSNTGYMSRGGYEWVNDFEYLKHGNARTIKTILANVHYERGESSEWATRYLGNFGFRKAGHLSQIGHKAGKVVDKLIFQLHTTEVIDP